MREQAQSPRPCVQTRACSCLSAPPQPGGGGLPLSSPLTLQIISQGQAKAEEITPDVGAQMKRVLQVELAAVLRRWGMGVCARGRGSLQPPRSESLPLPSPCALGGHPGWISAPSLPPGHLAF